MAWDFDRRVRLHNQLNTVSWDAGDHETIATVLPDIEKIIIEGFDPRRRDAHQFQNSCLVLLSDVDGLRAAVKTLCRILAAPHNPIDRVDQSALVKGFSAKQLHEYGVSDALDIIMFYRQGTPQLAHHRLDRYSPPELLRMFISLAGAVNIYYSNA